MGDGIRQECTTAQSGWAAYNYRRSPTCPCRHIAPLRLAHPIPPTTARSPRPPATLIGGYLLRSSFGWTQPASS
jgi:hypothetical protein